ncbi:hypothetical protein DUI87_07868 [Hirundo rustica rustica]|uniref:DUF4708 domain-containing protein n=1 Tax=Hirundo rustica rustica TaxID=333673 RepID=A0A3M0KRW2_HIRRU|nr:hypothetical protein DUI87_07868 [Hirundo rustica rustica]
MKMGQIINISHIIPPESPFRSYKDFEMHWKSLEIKPTKLDGEMVCVVSLTQARPRKPFSPGIPSPCSTENSHWMECLIKEPGTYRFSSSCRSTGGVSVEATEKSMSSKQIPGLPELPSVKSSGTRVNSAFESTPPKVSKIIPIFKGKLMQMNGKITNQTDRKKRENAERRSPVVSVGVSSAMLSVNKSSITEVFKHIQNMPVKTPTDNSMLQVKNKKAHTKHGTPIFRWKTQSSGQIVNTDFSENSASGGNPNDVNHKKANSPFFLKNVGPVLQKSNTSPRLNTHESPVSSARRGKKFASQSTTQCPEKEHQPKEVHLQICELDNEITNSSLSLQQTKRSNKGAGLNIHESVFRDTVCVAKREENKAACHSKDCTAETTNHHSKPNFEQMITGNKYLACETLTSKPTLPVKESNMEASVQKGCARRRQLWAYQHQKQVDLLKWVWSRAPKMIRELEHLCCGDRLRELQLFSLEGRRLWDHLTAAFQPKGTREQEKDCLQGHGVIGHINETERDRLRSDVKRKFFTVSIVRHWSGLPRKAVGTPSLEGFKAMLDGALSNLV